MAAESTTSDYAVEVALNDAGLSEDDVTIEDVEKGNEQGASVYEVEFWTDSAEYEYDIAVRIIHQFAECKSKRFKRCSCRINFLNGITDMINSHAFSP